MSVLEPFYTDKDWKNHFATLDENQRKNPFMVIEVFCDMDNLFGIRETFRDLFLAGMTKIDEYNRKDDPYGASNWISFYINTLQLMEGAFMIEKMREEGRLIYSIKPDEE
jgi:hypothetical protein